MKTVLAVALGGAAGASARYGIYLFLAQSAWIKRAFGGVGEVVAIFLVNITGCFLFGLLRGWAKSADAESVALFVLTGILGGYTTFSTFGWDTFELLRTGRPLLAAANAGASVIAGVLAVWLGVLMADAMRQG